MLAYIKAMFVFGIGGFLVAYLISIIFPKEMGIFVYILATPISVIAAVSSVFAVWIFKEKKSSNAMVAGMCIAAFSGLLAPMIGFAIAFKSIEWAMLILGVLGNMLCGFITLPIGAGLGWMAQRLIHSRSFNYDVPH